MNWNDWAFGFVTGGFSTAYVLVLAQLLRVTKREPKK